MSKQKLLFIASHLSTGGMPQYLLKQIKTFKDEFDISVVEYNHVSSDYVVQRNQIKDICKLYTLGDNKNDLITIINEVEPDIIHFQEIPETFVEAKLLGIIFNDKRSYNIIISTHSSYTEPSSLLYLPDRFVLVSEWSRKKFAEYFTDIECDIWEYPIDYWTGDKDEAKRELGFEPEYKHVLHVGLFTDGKNQGHLFDLARLCEHKGYKVKFHFVGNQAGNFQFYWGPLMERKPDNCIIWGEREDTDKFYKAADLFYFPSRWELNPLSVKEAMGYNLPIFITKLHTYENYFDDKATYVSDFMQENLTNLVKVLQPTKEVPGWFSYEWLYDKFINEIKDGGKIVEIGSWFGKSTNYLLDKLNESGKFVSLDCIDTFKGTLNEDLHQQLVEEFDNDIYQEFYSNIKSKGLEEVNIIKDYSNEASTLYKNGEIDAIMIDGDHSYEGVTNDIKDYFYKVKPGGIISGDDINVFSGTTEAVNQYFMGAHHLAPNSVNWWYKLPRIQLIHVSTIPTQDRAKKSMKNISMLEKYNVDIKYIQNEPYTGEIDLDNYRWEERKSTVKPSHYGCYLGHTQALKEIDTENYDYTIIMEEDAYIYTGLREFMDMVHKAIFMCEQDDVRYVSFAGNESLEPKPYNDLFTNSWHQDLAHCYLIPNKHKEWYMNKIETNPWDVADLWYNHIFCHDRQKRLLTTKPFSKQVNAVSVIDEVYKKWK